MRRSISLSPPKRWRARTARTGWTTAKVAYRQMYTIASNWKLAVENYVECYHCAPAHPEYSALHALELGLDRIAELNRRMEERTLVCAARVPHANHWVGSDTGAEAAWSFRYALHEGMVTGSEGGQAVAPLMGDFTGYDGGCTATHIAGNSFFLAYPDHGVIYRFIPRSLQMTDMELIWLVRADAVEGRDYDLARLIWLWTVTSDADKRIIENNQKGVNSRFYEPGPFAPMEYNERRYTEWYLKEVA